MGNLEILTCSMAVPMIKSINESYGAQLLLTVRADQRTHAGVDLVIRGTSLAL